jgi:enoyl-[acyl-carrier protein] reductase I
MTSWKPDWVPKQDVAVGKGATVQEFVATVGDVKLEIDAAPWGEGHLKVNGREIGTSPAPRIDGKRFATSN